MRRGEWQELLRWRAEAALFRLAAGLIPRLSRHATLRLARCCGKLAYRVARRDRRIALANLDLAFGASRTNAERRALARASFQTFSRVMFDLLWFSRSSCERLARYVRFAPALEDWIREPKPAIFVTAHFGNWELLGQAAAARGLKLASVAKPLANPWIDAALWALRAGTGQRILPARGALKPLLRTLREGGAVALLLDQDTRPAEGGVFVDFFGVPAPISMAAGLLAFKTGAPVVPVFAKAEPDGGYACHAQEPLLPPRSPEDPAHAQAIAAAFEAEIRKEPAQWLWMYKRWKRRRPGADWSRYPFYADC